MNIQSLYQKHFMLHQQQQTLFPVCNSLMSSVSDLAAVELPGEVIMTEAAHEKRQTTTNNESR